jgi:hypothetical protein
LTRADWFRRLRDFRTGADEADVAVPLATGLGALPELHTLDLSGLAPEAVPALAAGTFPALQRFLYSGPLGRDAARALAGARFPALVAFVGHSAWNGRLDDAALPALLKAGWFGRLRVLDLAYNRLTDTGIRALVAHPVAKVVRILDLGGNRFCKGGLTALAKRGGAFPALTTLVMGSGVDTFARRNNRADDLAAFLSALRLPRLRHLDLDGWPLGNAGAKALAENPAFAGLTRLSLQSCFIGDPGAKALFASPHLQNLSELLIHSNSIKNGADALLDPTVMPRLAECWLHHNTLPDATIKKLTRKRPGFSL